jgi:hypothetical protein
MKTMSIVPNVVPLWTEAEDVLDRAMTPLAGGKVMVIGYAADGSLYCDSSIRDGAQTVFALEWAKAQAMAAAIETAA